MSTSDELKKRYLSLYPSQSAAATAVFNWLRIVIRRVREEVATWPSTLTKCPKYVRLFAHVVIITVLGIFLLRATDGIARFVRDERCLFRVPGFLQNAFVPPYNCTLCERLTEVPSILANETEKYRHWISRKEVPLVIRGAYERIATSSPLTWATLRELYFQGGSKRLVGDERTANEDADGNRLGETSFTTCQFFAYKTEFKSLREALSMSKERMARQFYIGWSNCEPAVSEFLRRVYRVPDLVPADSERSALEWFFVGNRGKGAHLHLDRLDKPSWQAQLGGVKRWTFHALPECYWSCQQISADLHPGDVIMLDSSVWYHKTEVISDELSIALGSEYD